jgi:ABC-type lipoprotein release transport system permease subunit
MYKLLLCWRYLRTRWIALASVISVTLGVATMIVVNAVMAGVSMEFSPTLFLKVTLSLAFRIHNGTSMKSNEPQAIR